MTRTTRDRRTAAARACLGVLLLTAGCMLKFGPTPDSFEPAKVPNGIRASMALSESAVEGELLEVQYDGLLLLSSDRVVRVPFSAITSSAFTSTRVALSGGKAPEYADREQLRLLSRFPQGMPAPALQQLLASKQQTSVVVLK